MDSLENIADELIKRYRAGEALDALRLPDSVMSCREKIALSALVAIRGGFAEMEPLAEHILMQPSPGTSEREATDPHALVHVIVEDGFDGAVTGELCPYSGIYTTREGLEKILRGGRN